MKILIVDDELGLRVLLRRVLELEGHQVTEATSGNAAVALLEQNPDLIISDMEMLDGDGESLTRKSKGQNKERPVLLTSGMLGREVALQAGADDFLQKPYHPLALRAKIHKLQKVTLAELQQLLFRIGVKIHSENADVNVLLWHRAFTRALNWTLCDELDTNLQSLEATPGTTELKLGAKRLFFELKSLLSDMEKPQKALEA